MKQMKNCGIAWLGEIPTWWCENRLKYCFAEHQTGAWGEEKGDDLIQCSCVRVADFSYENGITIKEKDLTQRFYTSDEIKNKQLKQNDLLMEKSGGGDKTPVGRVVLFNLQETCLCANFIEFLRLKNNFNAEYFNYLFHTLYFRTVNKLYYTQTTGIQNINVMRYLGEYIYLPPLPEQTTIANFLCNKCEKIDTIIALEETIISELNEYKNQLAVKFVTKGIKKTKLRQSNIDWVGEIPEHWEVLPLYAIFNEHKCKNFKMQENNLLSLSYGNIIRKDINTDEGLLPENFEGYNIVEKGDIVLRLTDMQNDQRSLRTGLVKERGIITSAYVTIRNKINAYPDYLRYLLHSTDICKIIYNYGSGIRQNLTFDGLKSMPLVLPPIKEQKEIADYIDKKLNQVDNLINIKQQKIAELKDYKKSLIYEYVTGKKKPPKGVYK